MHRNEIKRTLFAFEMMSVDFLPLKLRLVPEEIPQFPPTVLSSVSRRGSLPPDLSISSMTWNIHQDMT